MSRVFIRGLSVCSGDVSIVPRLCFCPCSVPPSFVCCCSCCVQHVCLCVFFLLCCCINMKLLHARVFLGQPWLLLLFARLVTVAVVCHGSTRTTLIASTSSANILIPGWADRRSNSSSSQITNSSIQQQRLQVAIQPANTLFYSELAIIPAGTDRRPAGRAVLAAAAVTREQSV